MIVSLKKYDIQLAKEDLSFLNVPVEYNPQYSSRIIAGTDLTAYFNNDLCSKGRSMLMKCSGDKLKEVMAMTGASYWKNCTMKTEAIERRLGLIIYNEKYTE